ncbi:MAG: class IV adenylate cyclase [Nitrospiraceae bacterium]|nr:class IV adenylate cyclase [Nitrospiraceae bacterium]
MLEAEVKILGINRKAVEQRLISLGASLVFDGPIHAVYYDSPDRSVRKQKGTLRLRKEGLRAVLTYKGHVEDRDAKVRQETEVTVSDFEGMRSILESLGFTPWLEMEKHRTSYDLSGVRFELDKYHGEHEYIPEFLEIEGPDVPSVRDCASLLGFRKEDCLPWDAVQLARHYKVST